MLGDPCRENQGRVVTGETIQFNTLLEKTHTWLLPERSHRPSHSASPILGRTFRYYAERSLKDKPLVSYAKMSSTTCDKAYQRNATSSSHSTHSVFPYGLFYGLAPVLRLSADIRSYLGVIQDSSQIC
jgi:hypothetical protein